MKKKNWLILLSLILILSACGKKQNINVVHKEDVLRVGVITPLSGFLSVLGNRTRHGLEMALKEINQDSKKVELVYEDGGCDPKMATSAFNKLVDIDGIDYIFGPLCVETNQAVLPLLSKNGRALMFSLGAVSFRTELGNEQAFSFVFNIEQEDKKLAEFAFNQLGAKSAGVLGGNTDWGVKHKDNFTNFFESLGGEVVLSQSYNHGETDFRTQLLKIKQANAEVVYVIENGNMVLSIYEQMAEMGLESKILAQYTFEHPDVLRAPKDILNRTFYSWPIGKNLNNKQLEFFDKYETSYGTGPEILALSAYDGLMVFYQAWEECGGGQGCIVEKIRNLKNHQGMSGEFLMNEYGEAERKFAVKTIKDGEFMFVN